jgi:hypothetical protein
MKTEIRAQVSSDVAEFLKTHSITVLPSKTVSRKNTASCRYRRGKDDKRNSGVIPAAVTSWWNIIS